MPDSTTHFDYFYYSMQTCLRQHGADSFPLLPKRKRFVSDEQVKCEHGEKRYGKELKMYGKDMVNIFFETQAMQKPCIACAVLQGCKKSVMTYVITDFVGNGTELLFIAFLPCAKPGYGSFRY